MPSLVKCVLEIEERCKVKGNVATIPLEYLLAVKAYLILFKDLCEIAVDYLGTTLYCLDDVDKANIKEIAEETY